MGRNPAIDILRGILLLFMTMTHLPTAWATYFGQPVGFISAAEGFVFISAFLAGKIFVELQERKGIEAATRWIFGRALRLYLIHLALLIVAFTVIAWVAIRFDRPAVRNLLDLYLQSPRKAAVSGAILLYQPPLLDILPMYILFFIGTPFVMGAAARWGWRWILGGSALIWLAAQFGLRAAVYFVIQRTTGCDIPLSATGAFDLFAWQMLWVLGLWFGAAGFRQILQILASNRGTLHAALAISCAIFFWRHLNGPTGFSDEARYLFWIDKWTLSPVRVINLAALVFVLIGFRNSLTSRLPLPAVGALGGASQWVFVAHIGSTLFLLCLVGQDDQPLRGAMGILVTALGYLTLFGVAAAHRRTRAHRPSTTTPESAPGPL